jgi:hypothetical protein
MQTSFFKSAHRLSLASIICIGITISCYLLEMIYNLIFITYFPHLGDSENLTESELVMSLAALGLIVVKVVAYIASIVFFLMWLYRAYKNLEALKIRNLDSSAGWAVGYWFIPIVNLFKPFKIVSEVYNGSDPEIAKAGYGFSDTTTTSTIGFWWACWVFSNIASRIASGIEKAAKDVTETSVMVYVVALALGIMAGILLIFIIRDIDSRQAECERLLSIQQPPRPPVFNQPDFNPPHQTF